MHSVSVGVLMISFGKHLGFDMQILKEVGVGATRMDDRHEVALVEHPRVLTTRPPIASTLTSRAPWAGGLSTRPHSIPGSRMSPVNCGFSPSPSPGRRHDRATCQ